MDIIYRREILPELKSFSSSNDICLDLVLLLEVINMINMPMSSDY